MNEKAGIMKKDSLAKGYLLLTILPLAAVIIILSFVTVKKYSDSVADMVGKELNTSGKLILSDLDKDFPGDYVLKEVETGQGTGVQIMKGDTVISRETDLFDGIRDITDTEYSLIYADTRIVTTLRDKNDIRAVGTGVNEQVLNEVYGSGYMKQYGNVTINGTPYLAVYLPVCNSDGTAVGMLELAKQRTKISSIIRETLIPFLLIALICIIFFAFISLKSASGTLERITKLESFLIRVSEGNLGESMDQEVLKSNDELSQAGRAALTMQKSLRNLIEKDALTEIYNRRYATGYLTKVLEKARVSGQPFAVSIGDIDFFKKVNDTYGHDYGDIVLKEVASVLKNKMIGHGMAARFGGEEFLMVFDKENMEDGAKVLSEVLKTIRAREFTYGDTVFSVTMTFGIVDGDADLVEDELLKLADENLYSGKQGGRNRIVKGDREHA